MVTSPDFEHLVLLAIGANCTTLAMYLPTEPESHPINSAVQTGNTILNALFTLEVFLRLIHHGGVRAYLRHPWNVFDLLLVMVGYVGLVPQVAGADEAPAMRALRALRALRPLRSITRMVSLRAVVVAFLTALTLLMQVVGMMIFTMLLFGVAALSLLQDAYHYQCYDPGSNTFEVGTGVSPDEFGCGSGRSCPSDFPVCAYKPGPGRGETVAGFDNIGTALLTVFQIITISDWSFIMYRCVDNTSWVVVIWFVLLILFGAYFVVNLFLAVLKLKFGKAQVALEEENRLKQAADRRLQDAENVVGEGRGVRRGCLVVLGAWLQLHMRRGRRGRETSHKPEPEPGVGMVVEGDKESVSAGAGGIGTDIVVGTEGQSVVEEGAKRPQESDGRGGSDGGISHGCVGGGGGGGGGCDTLVPITDHQPKDSKESKVSCDHHDAERKAITPANSHGVDHHHHQGAITTILTTAGSLGISQGGRYDPTNQDATNQLTESARARQRVARLRYELTLPRNTQSPTRSLWLRIRLVLCHVADSRTFTYYFFFLIFASTTLLAMEYDGMSDEYANALNICNYVCTGCFTFELLVKICGYGWYEFFGDAFNVFDLIVVSMANVELVTEASVGGLASLRAIKALRALKSLRAFRSMKYLQSLRKIGKVLITSSGAFASVTVLIFLFMFVFTVIGLHQFGAIILPVGALTRVRIRRKSDIGGGRVGEGGTHSIP